MVKPAESMSARINSRQAHRAIPAIRSMAAPDAIPSVHTNGGHAAPQHVGGRLDNRGVLADVDLRSVGRPPAAQGPQRQPHRLADGGRAQADRGRCTCQRQIQNKYPGRDAVAVHSDRPHA